MCSYVQQMAADDDKALLLGNGYKAWSEVHTGLGERLDILLGDASGVQIEMDYENIGMTKVDAQERLGQGIGSFQCLVPSVLGHRPLSCRCFRSPSQFERQMRLQAGCLNALQDPYGPRTKLCSHFLEVVLCRRPLPSAEHRNTWTLAQTDESGE